jgi:hypothetical protein
MRHDNSDALLPFRNIQINRVTHKKAFNITGHTVFIDMRANTEDYVLAICITWMMMVGYFIVITREITLLIGLIFPLLILLLLKSRKEKKHLEVL